MKLGYKLLITLGIIIIVGNSMYVFNWTRDMLKGYFIGNVIGIITMIVVYWLCLDKNKN